MNRKTPSDNWKSLMTLMTLDTRDTLNFNKKIGETFVNRNGNVVTLHPETKAGDWLWQGTAIGKINGIHDTAWQLTLVDEPEHILT